MFTSLKKLGFPKNRMDRRFGRFFLSIEMGDSRFKPQRQAVRVWEPQTNQPLDTSRLDQSCPVLRQSVRKSESPWLSKPQGFLQQVLVPGNGRNKRLPTRKTHTFSDLPIPSCSFCLVQEWATHWSYQSWGLNVGVRYSWKNTSLVDGKCLGFFKFWVYVKYKWLKWLESNPPAPVTG